MDARDKSQIRLILGSLAVSQAVSSANIAITFMVGSILLVQLSGGKQFLAGAPGALTLLVSSAAALGIGKLKDRLGYRFTLKLGLASGIAAGILASAAAGLQSRAGLLAAMVLVGLATGSIMLCRFAAAEMHPPQQRGKALSRVMLGATVGAISGPALANFAESAGGRFGLPGPVLAFAIVAVLYLAGFLSCSLLMRVEPRDLAHGISRSEAAGVAGGLGEPLVRGFISDRAFALGSLFFAQVAMIFIMAVTPVHMHHNHHGYGEITLVLMAHFFGMYGCSFLSGGFADRFGRAAAIGAGASVLLASCLLAAYVRNYAGILAALFLLGLGWSFCFISATALVSDSLKAVANKGRLQGAADAFVNVGSALAGFSSGFFLEGIGFRGMAMAGCLLAVMPGILLSLRAVPARVGAEAGKAGA